MRGTRYNYVYNRGLRKLVFLGMTSLATLATSTTFWAGAKSLGRRQVWWRLHFRCLLASQQIGRLRVIRLVSAVRECCWFSNMNRTLTLRLIILHELLAFDLQNTQGTSKTHHSRSVRTGHPLVAGMLFNASLRCRRPSNMSYVDHQRVLTSLGGSLKEMSFTEHACLSLALNCIVQHDSGGASWNT
jgi:hypothetical protein